MTDEGQDGDPGEAREVAPETGPPRTVNVAVLAGAVVLIGLVAFALYRRNHAGPAQPATEAGAPAAQPADASAPEQGTTITAQIPIHLTPEASIIAERYRCVCSCNDPLSVCTCSKTPGSRDMKQYVQELVNQKKSGKEIDAAMAARYGPNVLIGASAPAPTPAPARTKR
jgi:LPXTG-motif cell wall-anchored protein